MSLTKFCFAVVYFFPLLTTAFGLFSIFVYLSIHFFLDFFFSFSYPNLFLLTNLSSLIPVAFLCHLSWSVSMLFIIEYYPISFSLLFSLKTSNLMHLLCIGTLITHSRFAIENNIFDRRKANLSERKEGFENRNFVVDFYRKVEDYRKLFGSIDVNKNAVFNLRENSS